MSNIKNKKLKEGCSKEEVKKCRAWCCKGFIRPTCVKDEADFLNNFENVEIHPTTDKDWYAFIVHSRCKHLTEDNRCAIYGKLERPKICNEFKCGDPNRPFGLLKKLESY